MKMLTTYFNLTLISFLIFSGTAVASEVEQREIYREVNAEISRQWSEFFGAWVNGDAKKSAGFFTENGMHFRPGAAIDKGRARIEEVFSMMLSTSKVEYCTQDTLEIEVIGDTVIEYGVYAQKWLQSEEEMKGGYFAIWKGYEQNNIKLHRLLFN